MSQALLTLLQNLAIIGHDADGIDVNKGENEEITVTLNNYGPAKIVIIISEFWRYPGLFCYFVNYNHPNGNFSCNMGTPHIAQAMFNIGNCAGLIR